MGSAEKVCYMNVYKLFIVATNVFFGNDSEKLFGKLRGLSHHKILGCIGHGREILWLRSTFVIKSTNI